MRVEAPLLVDIMEFFHLSILFRMVGFIFDVLDSCKSTGDGEARTPFPSAVRTDGPDDERGTFDDVMQEGDGIVLRVGFIDLRQSEAGPIIDTVIAHSLRSISPGERTIHLDFFSNTFFDVERGFLPRQTFGDG